MKHIFIIGIGLILSLTANGQTIDLGDFDYLKASTSVSVNLIPSASNRAEVEMIKGDFDKLIVEVKGETLVIKFKNKKFGWGNSGKANIDLYFKNLEGLDISAGSSVVTNDLLKVNKFTIDASSGSNCNLELDARDIDLDVSSGSSVTLRGVTDELSIDASSGSSVNALRLEANEVNAEASSGASAKVWATQSIEAEASSGASVNYKGEPTQKNIDESKYSGGSVRAIKGN